MKTKFFPAAKVILLVGSDHVLPTSKLKLKVNCQIKFRLGQLTSWKIPTQFLFSQQFTFSSYNLYTLTWSGSYYYYRLLTTFGNWLLKVKRPPPSSITTKDHLEESQIINLTCALTCCLAAIWGVSLFMKFHTSL